MADKTVLDLEANMIYQLVSVLTLYVDDIERSLHGRDREFRFGKKMLFKRIKESAQAVGFAYDELMGDIIKDAKTAKNYQEWQEESNYLARVLLLYIEKISPSPKSQSLASTFTRLISSIPKQRQETNSPTCWSSTGQIIMWN